MFKRAVTRIRLLLVGLSLVALSAACTEPGPSELELPAQHCVSDIDAWMERSEWPTDAVLLGDQIYSKDRLFNLSKSRGNLVADLAMHMATLQLNMAAGAKPNAAVIDALFEADSWLLDTREEERRSQAESGPVKRLAAVLAAFNQDAARQSCAGASEPMRTAMR